MILNKINTLDLYKNIDKATTSHFQGNKKQPPCAKGCSSCCSQFFEISELEYDIIHDLLATQSNKQQIQLKNKSLVMMDMFQEHWPDFYDSYFKESTYLCHDEAYYNHPERFKVRIPCIFLSKEGACEIYEVRPIVCRTTGVGFIHLFNPGAICTVMKNGLFTPFWQADLRSFKEAIDAIRWLDDDSNIGVKRQYPMFFYIYNRL